MKRWDKVFQQVKTLNKRWIDPMEMVSRRDVDMALLLRMLDVNSFHRPVESKEKHLQEVINFYKEHSFWLSPENLPLESKAVVPFPALVKNTAEEITEAIFRERTKTLVKLVATNLQDLKFSQLNWWYYVKTLFPELDNQILSQFTTTEAFSFEDNEQRTHSMSLAEFMRHRGRSLKRDYEIKELFIELAEKNVSYIEDLVLPSEEKTIEEHNELYDDFADLFVRYSQRNTTHRQPPQDLSALLIFQSIKSLFSALPLRKRLRAMTAMTFPLNQESRDTVYMFLQFPREHWEKQNTLSSDHHWKVDLTDVVTIKQLHDKIMFKVRTLNVPLVSIDQSVLHFLESYSFGKYKVKVPRSNHDLDFISHRLNNCVGRGGYQDKIQQGEVFILEVLKEDKSYGCLEFSRTRRKFIQAKVVHNQQFPDQALLTHLENVICSKVYPSLLKKLKKLIFE